MNLTVPEEFVNNPSKVAKLFEKKLSLEKELQANSGVGAVENNPPSRLRPNSPHPQQKMRAVRFVNN